MWVGEDKNKVNNIVDGQLSQFSELYAPARETLAEFMEVVDGAGRQDVSPAARFYHLSMLPRELQVRDSDALRKWRLVASSALKLCSSKVCNFLLTVLSIHGY